VHFSHSDITIATPSHGVSAAGFSGEETMALDATTGIGSTVGGLRWLSSRGLVTAGERDELSEVLIVYET